MVVAGIIGAGLVWGWLLVLLLARPKAGSRAPQPTQPGEAPTSKWAAWFKSFLVKWQTERRPYLNLIAVAVFTIWFAWLIYAFTNATLLIPFFIALIIAFSLHFAWRQQLRRSQKESS